jgi:N-methylhydantoinase B/oxoprolinase/acetone carboxylase alpha subunit
LRAKGRVTKLPSKTGFSAPAGSVLRIETPGGGGWGRKKKETGARSQKPG